MDALWRKEAEDRVKAYQSGKIKAVSLRDVMRSLRPNLESAYARMAKDKKRERNALEWIEAILKGSNQ